MDEWINKIQYMYSAVLVSLNSEILSFVITGMNLEGIVLSEVSQTKKNKYCSGT